MKGRKSNEHGLWELSRTPIAKTNADGNSPGFVVPTDQLHPRLSQLSSHHIGFDQSGHYMMPARGARTIICLAIALAGAPGMFSGRVTPASAEQLVAGKNSNVFQMPQFAEKQRLHTMNVLKLFRRQRYADAEQALRKLIHEFPDWPMHHFIWRQPWRDRTRPMRRSTAWNWRSARALPIARR